MVWLCYYVAALSCDESVIYDAKTGRHRNLAASSWGMRFAAAARSPQP
jgi:hypothetical protein